MKEKDLANFAFQIESFKALGETARYHMPPDRAREMKEYINMIVKPYERELEILSTTNHCAGYGCMNPRPIIANTLASVSNTLVSLFARYFHS